MSAAAPAALNPALHAVPAARVARLVVPLVAAATALALGFPESTAAGLPIEETRP